MKAFKLTFVASFAVFLLASGCGQKVTFSDIPVNSNLQVALVTQPTPSSTPSNPPNPQHSPGDPGPSNPGPGPNPPAPSPSSSPSPQHSPTSGPSPITGPSNGPSNSPSPVPSHTVCPKGPNPKPSPSSSPSSPPNDSSDDDGDGVFINVQKVLLHAQMPDGGEQFVTVAENLGLIEMGHLSGNVLKVLGNISLPAGATVQDIRIITYPDGSKVVRDGEKICDMKVPSGSESGVKLQIQHLTIDPNLVYRLSLHFNADQSVVYQGNGGCSLKPSYSVQVDAAPVSSP